MTDALFLRSRRVSNKMQENEMFEAIADQVGMMISEQVRVYRKSMRET